MKFFQVSATFAAPAQRSTLRPDHGRGFAIRLARSLQAYYLLI